MIIAIDYDDTYSADPEGWKLVIELMQGRGHQFVCVTGRSNQGQFGQEVMRAINGFIPVIFAGEFWKKEAAAKAGWKVDVWIDDNPEYIAKQHMLFNQFKK